MNTAMAKKKISTMGNTNKLKVGDLVTLTKEARFCLSVPGARKPLRILEEVDLGSTAFQLGLGPRFRTDDGRTFHGSWLRKLRN